MSGPRRRGSKLWAWQALHSTRSFSHQLGSQREQILQFAPSYKEELTLLSGAAVSLVPFSGATSVPRCPTTPRPCQDCRLAGRAVGHVAPPHSEGPHLLPLTHLWALALPVPQRPLHRPCSAWCQRPLRPPAQLGVPDTRGTLTSHLKPCVCCGLSNQVPLLWGWKCFL